MGISLFGKVLFAGKLKQWQEQEFWKGDLHSNSDKSHLTSPNFSSQL